MASNVRQERRRKIMERGNDRLALITGQIQSLNESPSSTPTFKHHSHTESSPSIMLSSDDISKSFVDSDGLDNASVAKLMKLRSITAVTESKSLGSPRISETRFRPSSINPERNMEILDQIHESQKSVASHGKTRPSGFETETRQIQDSKVVVTQSPSNYHEKLFASRRINASIIASEKIRAICSLIVAFLVIISYNGYHLFGSGIIISRPLYFIIITDITIVVARLFHEMENDGFEEEAEGGVSKEGDEDNWDGAVKLLERGLVLYQVTRAIFIDSSVYLVVVICGLSLV